jgi:hypothetical protein
MSRMFVIYAFLVNETLKAPLPFHKTVSRLSYFIKLCSETLKERENSKGLGLDGGIIVNLILDQHNGDSKLRLFGS